MIISAQKSASINQVNTQNMHLAKAFKISVLNIFTDKQKKLWVFLIKLNLYIKFNQNKFKFKMNKKLYAVFLLKDAIFNWVNLKLHEFLDKMIKKKNKNKELIFNNYWKFKKELHQVFRIVNKKKVAKQQLHVLW